MCSLKQQPKDAHHNLMIMMQYHWGILETGSIRKLDVNKYISHVMKKKILKLKTSYNLQQKFDRYVGEGKCFYITKNKDNRCRIKTNSKDISIKKLAEFMDLCL